MPAYDSLYLSLSDNPRAIVRKMVEFKASRAQIEQQSQQRRRLPLLLLLAGFGFLAFDLLILRLILGYGVCLLTPAAVASWIAAVVIFVNQRRSTFQNLSPRFDAAVEIIRTLQDDIRPGSSFLGHIDLTGLEQDKKIAQEAKDRLGRTNRLYKDPWLNMKLKLYDGNILRFSVVERYKTRLGYWKRGQISGKTKWKQPKFKGRLHELGIRVSANPEAFTIAPPETLRPGSQVGPFLIQKVDFASGTLSVLAAAQQEPAPQEILGLLRNVYDSLTRKEAA